MKGHGRILREVERTLAGIPAVIRYKNIKNLYLRISVDGSRIELSVPRRTLMCDMEDFVRRRRAWIEARLRSMREKKPPSLYAAGILCISGAALVILPMLRWCTGRHTPNRSAG